MSRSRGYVFTINNWDEPRLELVKQHVISHAKYAIIGDEVGEHGTPHLQGYVYYGILKSFKWVVERLGEPRAHVESAKGSPSQNKDYCSKQSVLFEHGELPRQGRRSDLDEIRGRLDRGDTEAEIAKDHFSTWCIFRRSFTAYKRLANPIVRSWKTVVVWIYGPTGTGKTRVVHELSTSQLGRKLQYTCERYHGSSVEDLRGLYVASDVSLQWCDGYEGQDIVLMDDYRGEAPLSTLLRVLDRYPMSMPVKGGFTDWAPKLLFITSNWTPRQAYSSKAQEELEPLYRRIDFLFEKNKNSDFKDISNTIRF